MKSPVRVNGQATVNRLLKYSAAEIKRNGVANYDLDDVLRRSKTSKGSLYHHFGSKNGLIAATQSHTISADIGRDNQSLRAFIEAAKSKDEMLAILDFAIQHGITSDSAEARKSVCTEVFFVDANHHETTWPKCTQHIDERVWPQVTMSECAS